MARSPDYRMMDSQMPGGMDEGRLFVGAGTDRSVPAGSTLLGASSGETSLTDLTEAKRKLAKKANRIYRSLCNELELGECFFNGFGAWSEFVEGKISETSFYEKAKEEARDIAGRVEKIAG